jgi:hypothetical protein
VRGDRDVRPEDIEQVKQALLRRGWIQGSLDTEEGVCLMGGVNVAFQPDVRPMTAPRGEQVADVIETYLLAERDAEVPECDEPVLRPVAAWNDAPGRTLAEVTAMLDECAVWVKERSDG